MTDTDHAGNLLFGYRDIAERLGVSVSTLRNYRNRGYMPSPDVMLADRPRWYESTIIRWEHQRKVGSNTERHV